MSTIDETYALPPSDGPKIVEKDNGMLGKDDFLKILIAQLANQDPMNPMEDKEFVAQMAQFSSLEQMTNMNASMQRLANTFESGSLVKHSELIGKSVTWLKAVEEHDMVVDVEEVINTVHSVKRDQNGNILLLLDDDRWINSQHLLQVNTPEDLIENEDEPEEDTSESENKEDAETVAKS